MPIAAAVLAAALVALLVFRFVVTLRTEMADFLPQGGTPAAQLLLDQLRAGPATSLILIGIEGAPPDRLARVSQAMTDRLAASGAFTFVGNGRQGLDQADEKFLFDHRYLLSDVTKPEAFTPAALGRISRGCCRDSPPRPPRWSRSSASPIRRGRSSRWPGSGRGKAVFAGLTACGLRRSATAR